MDLNRIVIIAILAIIAIVGIIGVVVLISTFAQRSKAANFDLPDLNKTEKEEYYESTVSKKIPEVDEKSLDSIMANVNSSVDIDTLSQQFESDINKEMKLAAKPLPQLNKEEVNNEFIYDTKPSFEYGNESKTYTAPRLDLEDEFDSMMRELDE